MNCDMVFQERHVPFNNNHFNRKAASASDETGAAC